MECEGCGYVFYHKEDMFICGECGMVLCLDCCHEHEKVHEKGEKK